eukprot:GEMP01009083.1.p1 GENE.GEMP01009083.1~~GEMP01009083.1.p1  ORF type:complete len:665 (+),score=108.40 GEMP01009083.1:20-2014(+)
MQPSPLFDADGVMDDDAFRSTYMWVIIAGAFSAFLMAYGIGANDVANAFATSVGAKSLTFKQAVIIGAICETLGAAFLGAEVADTVRKDIIDMDYFNWNPELFLLAMCCAIFSSGIWLILCSYNGLPVSTTHTIIGALIGIGLAINPAIIKWSKVGLLVLSWFVSPVLAAIVGATFFLIFRSTILRSHRGHQRAFMAYPLLLFLVIVSICVSFVLKCPLTKLRDLVDPNIAVAMSITVPVAAAITAIGYLASYKWIKRKIEAALSMDPCADDAENPVDIASLESQEAIDVKIDSTYTGSADTNTRPAPNGGLFSLDIHEEGVKNDDELKKLHDNVEKFSPKTEEVFNILQIVSACYHSIAHGANDVANAIGPLAAMYYVYKDAEIRQKVKMPDWISWCGGIAISIGLLTYGYKVLMTMGVKLASITPSRGFSIEMGGTWIILVGSNFGIPLSTTHCQVGSTVGVGLCESPQPWKFKGVNVGLLGKVMMGWITTLIFTSVMSVALYTIVAVAYFPRIEPYECSTFVGNDQISTDKHLDSAYMTGDMSSLTARLKAVFNDWDTNQDEHLSVDEIKAKMGKKSIDDILSRWIEENEAMTLNEWLKWRCSSNIESKTSLNTVDLRCNPLCRNQTRTSEAFCKLSKRNADTTNGYALIANYQVNACKDQ